MEQARENLRYTEITTPIAGFITALNAEEGEVLEDLIAAAINDAKSKLETAAAEQMKSLTAGFPLPPGMKLPF